jgi:hypothetical protein
MEMAFGMEIPWVELCRTNKKDSTVAAKPKVAATRSLSPAKAEGKKRSTSWCASANRKFKELVPTRVPFEAFIRLTGIFEAFIVENALFSLRAVV